MGLRKAKGYVHTTLRLTTRRASCLRRRSTFKRWMKNLQVVCFIIHSFRRLLLHSLDEYLLSGMYCIPVNRAPAVTTANKRCAISALRVYRVDCGSMNFWPAATHGHRHDVPDWQVVSMALRPVLECAAPDSEQHNNNITSDALTNLMPQRVLNGM